MVRPVSLTRPRRMRRKLFKQSNALEEAGAVRIGTTKQGTGLYKLRREPRIEPIFKAEQIEMGVENSLHFTMGISKKKAKRAVGL